MPLQVIITAANTVSRASVAVSEPPDTIKRDDQRDLDHRHRDGEDERPERLADSVSDDLGVMHGREHRADQKRPTTTTTAGAGSVPHVSASGISASSGTATVQRAVMPPGCHVISRAVWRVLKRHEACRCRHGRRRLSAGCGSTQPLEAHRMTDRVRAIDHQGRRRRSLLRGRRGWSGRSGCCGGMSAVERR